MYRDIGPRYDYLRSIQRLPPMLMLFIPKKEEEEENFIHKKNNLEYNASIVTQTDNQSTIYDIHM